VMKNLCYYLMICHQHQVSFWKLSDVTVRLTVAVRGTHARSMMWNVLLLVATAEGQDVLIENDNDDNNDEDAT